MSNKSHLVCASCGDPVGQSLYRGLYVAPGGAAIPHALCDACGKRSERSRDGHRDIAGRVELRLIDPEGRA
jgi:hypothetical protein